MRSVIKVVLLLVLGLQPVFAGMKEVPMYSTYHLEEGDTLAADTHIKIYVGDAMINGVVNGKITLFGGNAELGETAVINGTLACYGGRVVRTNQDSVEDDNVRVANIQGKDVKSAMLDWISQTRNFDHSQIVIDDKKGKDNDRTFPRIFAEYDPMPNYQSTADYNRQDGFLVQLGTYRTDLGTLRRARIGIKLAYGFASKRPQGALMFSKGFFPAKNRLLFYAQGYSEMQNQDQWRINPIDNFLSSLFTKFDYYDRYKAEGSEAGVSQTLLGILKLKADYINQEEQYVDLYDSSLVRRWAPIRFQNDRFGKLIGYRGSVSLNLGHDPQRFPGAIQIGTQYEEYGSDYGGNLNFQRLNVDLRYIGTLFDVFQLRTHVVSAVSNGDVPDRYRYYIGGMGSLRGLKFKGYNGDRMLLATQELGLTSKDDDLFFFVFTDMGQATARTEKSLTEDLTNYRYESLLKTIGAGVETGDLDEFGIRLDAARDASDKNAPWVYTLRFSRMF